MHLYTIGNGKVNLGNVACWLCRPLSRNYVYHNHGCTQSTTSAKTIAILQSVFARNGLPEILVSVNGPQFTSEEFDQFTKTNGIKHLTSTPYHPATNELAERFVQTFKQSLRAMKWEANSVERKLENFLMAYRNASHATTNETPA